MSLFDKRYELPLARGYVAHWGFIEAVRELLQNALDSDSPFRCTYMGGCLRIVSRNSRLSADTLLLGTTTKAEDDTKIGSFGEGYKIALLVLTRESRRVTVYNGSKIWTPKFENSSTFDTEVLCIHETKRPGAWDDELIFSIDGVTESEWSVVKKSCLHLWDDDEFGEVIETSMGRILCEHPGELYVNGLYVCDTQLDFSYDIKPQFMKLERDRKTVSDWDLKLVTKNMWFLSEQWDRVAEMIDSNVEDLYHADIGCPELVKEACYRLFVTKNPGQIAVKTQAELDRYVANKMTNVVVVNSTYHSILGSTNKYHSSMKTLDRKTPLEDVQAWFGDNRKYMRKEAIVNFKNLINKASGWILK